MINNSVYYHMTKTIIVGEDEKQICNVRRNAFNSYLMSASPRLRLSFGFQLSVVPLVVVMVRTAVSSHVMMMVMLVVHVSARREKVTDVLL